MLTKEQSVRLQLLRFPLIVGVVFIHAYGAALVFSGTSIGSSQHNVFSDFIQAFISQEIARCAVPLFFLMSGYLFFQDDIWNNDLYVKKIKSRARTLFIPFLFWNILTLSFFALAQAYPETQAYFSGKKMLIAEYGIWDYLSAIFGIGRMPVSYQFWFIRDLMVLVLLTPLIYQLNKKLPLPFLGLLFILWFMNVGETTSESVFFFSLGCFLGINAKDLFAFDSLARRLWPMYLLLAIFNSAFPDLEFFMYLHKAGIILGVPLFLYLTKPLLGMPKLSQVIISLAATSFFVYAAHEPLLTVIKKVGYKILNPQHQGLILALYIGPVMLTIAILVISYGLMIRIFPVFTGYISGGR